MSTLCFNVDAFRLHSFLFKDRGRRLELGPPWDCDRGLGSGGSGFNSSTPQADNRPFNPRQWRVPTTDRAADAGTDFFGSSSVGVNWWDRLFRDPDFWQRWIDRYQALRRQAWNNDAMLDTVERFQKEITQAQGRDQQRWSTNFNWPRFGLQTVNGYAFDFGPRNPAFANGGSFEGEVAFQKRWLLDRFDFIDTNLLAMPRFTGGSGLVPAGTVITVSPASEPGTLLLYTLDDTDPRLPGGGISPAARTKQGDLTLSVSTNMGLVVRCYNSNHFNLTNVAIAPGVDPDRGSRGPPDQPSRGGPGPASPHRATDLPSRDPEVPIGEPVSPRRAGPPPPGAPNLSPFLPQRWGGIPQRQFQKEKARPNSAAASHAANSHCPHSVPQAG